MCVEGEYSYVHFNKHKNQECSSVPFPSSFPSPSPLPIPPFPASLYHLSPFLYPTPLLSSPALPFPSISPLTPSGKYKNLNENFVYLLLLEKKRPISPRIDRTILSGSHLNEPFKKFSFLLWKKWWYTVEIKALHTIRLCKGDLLHTVAEHW